MVKYHDDDLRAKLGLSQSVGVPTEYALEAELKFSPKGSEEELQYTMAKIVLSSINLPLSDINVRLAVKFLKGHNRESLDELYGSADKVIKRNRFKRDLAKYINKEKTKLQVAGNPTYDEAVAKLDKIAPLSNSVKKWDDVSDRDIMDLQKTLQGGVKLEKPQGTSLHHFMDYMEASSLDGRINAFFKNEFHSFVIEHNWAQAFANVKDFDGGEIRLPFDYTCFEFRISGVRVLVFLGEDDKGQIVGILASGINKRWYINTNKVILDGGRLYHPRELDTVDENVQDYLDLLGSQIRAVCIMLDAKVAVGEPKPSGGEGLNKRRIKEGKTPLKDYHVVTLAKRLRGSSDRDHEPTGIRRRLHWRRGHWRHFNSPGGEVRYINADGITVSKTWINWQLVGDETLGFVDKHYRL